MEGGPYPKATTFMAGQSNANEFVANTTLQCWPLKAKTKQGFYRNPEEDLDLSSVNTLLD